MTTDPTLQTEGQTDTNPLADTVTEESPTSSQQQELEETVQNLQEQLARSQADYTNLVRRSREESGQIGQWTEDKTILKFLPILDNLERSLEHIPAELVDNTWVEGNRSIVRSMQKVISDFGIQPMNSIGQEVNPDLHDVISQVPHQLTTIQAEVEK
ncbi:MAG: nucleotide exchange factor GrpE [bacterium]